ncbi:hypothetical protein J14TS5_26920 [Paenibacillus lautus]|nr:hypothetical protein J14TS5_26920 [Paenibacillus lautus]
MFDQVLKPGTKTWLNVIIIPFSAKRNEGFHKRMFLSLQTDGSSIHRKHRFADDFG